MASPPRRGLHRRCCCCDVHAGGLHRNQQDVGTRRASGTPGGMLTGNSYLPQVKRWRRGSWTKDHDGRTFFISQAFFPGGTNPWEKLQRALRGIVDEAVFETMRGVTSHPFQPGEHKRIAVKVVDRHMASRCRPHALALPDRGPAVRGRTHPARAEGHGSRPTWTKPGRQTGAGEACGREGYRPTWRRSRGSSRSRRPSPIRLNPITVIMMASPGKVGYHQ